MFAPYASPLRRILCWRSRHFELDASIRALEVADLNDDYDESINGERGPSSLAVSCSGNEGNPGLPATQVPVEWTGYEYKEQSAV